MTAIRKSILNDNSGLKISENGVPNAISEKVYLLEIREMKGSFAVSEHDSPLRLLAFACYE